MRNLRWMAAALFAAVAINPIPVFAAMILITQAKANAGNVTPGDTPGFPVTLSLPGAYRFDGNLTVPANANGIVVKSHYVDIDMYGFLLLGANAAGTKVAVHGVVSGYGDGNIHNGVISSFKGSGILLVAAPNSNAWVVEDMQIVSNSGFGIRADVSHYLRVSNSLILVNGQSGIYCAEYCHVEGNNISDNGAEGVRIGSGTVIGNTIFSNSSEGIFDWFPPANTGFGNNTIGDNFGGGTQVDFVSALHPNFCSPVAC